MKTKLWNIISNPPIIKINGIRVPAWQVPSIEDREAMVEAIHLKINENNVSNHLNNESS